MEQKTKFDFNNYSFFDLLDLLSTSSVSQLNDLTFDYSDPTDASKVSTYDVSFLDLGQIVLRPFVCQGKDEDKVEGIDKTTKTKVDEVKLNAYGIYLFIKEIMRYKNKTDVERLVRRALMSALSESMSSGTGQISVATLMRLGLINDVVSQNKDRRDLFVYLGDVLTRKLYKESRDYIKECFDVLFNDERIKLDYEKYKKLKAEKENKKEEEFKNIGSIYKC